MTVTEQHRLSIGGRSVAYTLRRSDRAKHARLEIGPRGGLTVIVPATYDSDHLRQLLLQKRRWITAKLDQYGETESEARQSPVKAGDTVPFLGNALRIQTRPWSGESGLVSVDGQNLVVSVAACSRDLRPALEKWYRAQARDRIEPMVDGFCARMGVSHNRVTLKSHRSLWGSCSRKRNLNFNWRLVMTPLPVIEYVVIHELAHLKEMNHSPRFWRLVERHCPKWRDHRKWLREHSQQLAGTLAV
jgi:predicted metal-dependent hydrolase